MITVIEFKENGEFIKSLWKQKEEWRAKYDIKRLEDKTVVYIEGKDANAKRALANYIFRFIVAFEKLSKLLW